MFILNSPYITVNFLGVMVQLQLGFSELIALQIENIIKII